MADLLSAISHYFAAVGAAGTKILLLAMVLIATGERTLRNRRLPWQWFYAIAFLIYLVAAPFSAWMELSTTKEIFMDRLDAIHPRYGSTIRMTLE
jgi:hypothetical protein